jgi:formate-nitrite transporter family protein
VLGRSSNSDARPEAHSRRGAEEASTPSPRARPETALKTHRAILEAEIAQAEEELQRPVHGLFVSGLLAGLAVGTSVLLMAALTASATGVLPVPIVRMLLASAFSVGFIIVILSRVDLFTEYTTIAILPVLTGRAPARRLGRLWGLIYAGNLVGAVAFAAFIVALAPQLGVADAEAFVALARDLIRTDARVIVGSAFLAGWLMGLLSWLVAAGRDTISQVFFVWLVTSSIGFTGLHHAITGTAEVAAAFLASDAFSAREASRFVVWTTIGNAFGGILFAVLIRYSLVMREADGGTEVRAR